MFDDLKDQPNNNQQSDHASKMIIEDMLADSNDDHISPLSSHDMPPQVKVQMSGQASVPIQLTQDVHAPTLITPTLPQQDQLQSVVENNQPVPRPSLEGVNDIPNMPDDPMAWSNSSDNTSTKKKVLAIGIIIVVLILLGIGGYVAYMQFFATQQSSDVPASATNTTEQPQDTNTNTVNEPINSNQQEINNNQNLEDNTNENLGLLIDSDGDGLTDSEEKEYNTDSDLADTDRDGLFDREEVISWYTDPLNPDSDGDSYLDGEEIRSGYNPLGPGTLEYFEQVNF